MVKRTYVKYFVLVSILLITGCVVAKKYQPSTANENSLIQQDIASIVTIKGYYEQPASLDNDNTIVLHGLSEGEFVEIVIQGEVYNFEHVRLEWDQNESQLIEKEIINSYNKLSNQTVVIRTYMPEGIPMEKIKWKSSTGKDYEYVISEYGLENGGDGKQEFILE